MQTVTESERRIDKEVSNLKDRMDKTKSSVENNQKHMKATINETIKDFGNKSRADAAVFKQIDEDIQFLKRQAIKIDQMDSQIDQMNACLNSAGQQGKYLAKSLPMQIHMAICEAMERVIEPKMLPELVQFEKEKIEEISKYNKSVD